MPFRPAFTTPIPERTSTPDGLLGSIAASLNLPVDDGAAALVWTSREALSGPMVSKWPTLQFHLRRVGHLSDPIAEDARKVMVTADAPFPVSPPNTVLSRAAMMLAAEGSMERAMALLDAYATRPIPGYPDDQDARIDAMQKYWEGISPAIAGELEDFPVVEAALARLINMNRGNFRFELKLGKSTVRDLMAGKMQWNGLQKAWLAERMEERALELRRFLACDDAFVADARPALVGLAWQLYPGMQDYIEEVSRWVQETPDGDPRTSWKDGWEGFDPALSPEGYIDEEI